jgi:hypothetical protein
MPLPTPPENEQQQQHDGLSDAVETGVDVVDIGIEIASGSDGVEIATDIAGTLLEVICGLLS